MCAGRFSWLQPHDPATGITSDVPAPHTSADTPVMRQYLEIKSRYADAILMFRMGDFYELFFEDAVEVGPVLDIAVTTRDRKDVENPVPMAGVPYHAIGGYLRTLVERGYKVAICEQMETPEQAKRRKGPKIVRREVVRVVTPGALLDEEHLRGNEPNYLVALVPTGDDEEVALAAVDISASDFFVLTAATPAELRAQLARIEPQEIVTAPMLREWLEESLAPACPRLEVRDEAPPPAAVQRAIKLYEESGGGAARRGPTQAKRRSEAESAPGLSTAEAQAAAAALGYAEATQPGQTLLLHRLTRQETSEALVLDEASLRNLEVFFTIRDGNRRGSLLWAIDRTKTSMGARMLRQWVGAPSRRLPVIAARQEAIEALLAQPRLREELQSRLRDVRDVVRLAARARLKTINPRELAALRASLAALPQLAERLTALERGRTDGALPALLELGSDLLEDVHAELVRVLIDSPPSHTRDGNVIKTGADPRLAEQRALSDGGKQALAAIETREREATGIPNLKIQHNRVFGYFIEVSKSHLGRVPKDYVRKQTLANAERYVTEELAGLEAKVLGAQSQALTLELELFEQLRQLVSDAGERLVDVGQRLATLDVLVGLSELAQEADFVRPRVVDEPVLRVEGGRHPVVEAMLGEGRFVPNDVELDAIGNDGVPRLLLVTGPNMGGKSTVMRQTALITILAHIGSYVPATAATVGLTDRVFTRVGAADDLGRGESTFMVEMREAAHILAQATRSSLVILDEVGRGTATFDGLAIAWAITEFLHDQVGCRALFATHYHELCALEQRLGGVRNVHVAVHENRGRIVFLHRLEEGAAGRSYGIAVGRKAGLPRRVLARATKILDRLEARERSTPGAQLDLFAAPATGEEEQGSAQRPDPRLEALLTRLEEADPDALTPREAHETLYELRDLLDAAHVP